MAVWVGYHLYQYNVIWFQINWIKNSLPVFLDMIWQPR